MSTIVRNKITVRLLNQSTNNKTIMQYIKDNIGIIAVCAPFISLAVSVIFKSIANWSQSGYYDYFGIDKKYIQIDYESSLISLISTAAVVIVVWAFIILLVKWFITLEIRTKILLIPIQLVLNLFIFWIYCLKDGITDYWQQIFSNLGRTISMDAYFAILIDSLIFSLGYCMVFPLYEKHDNVGRKNNKLKNDKNGFLKLFDNCIYHRATSFIVALAIIIGVSIAFYYSNLQIVQSQKNFEITKVGTQEYVILTKYDGEFYVCRCFLEGNNSNEQGNLIINKSEYKLLTIDGIEAEEMKFKDVLICNKKDFNDKITNLKPLKD